MTPKSPQGCWSALFLCLFLGLLAACGDSSPKPPKLPQPTATAPTDPPKPTAATQPSDLSRTADSFSEAKRWLYERVYFDHTKTFYCDCDYTRLKGRAGEINLASCGVQPRQDPERAKRLEAEHVFPAAQFGNFRPCWREPEQVCGQKMTGRKCCEQTDPIFIAAHNDLHNLFPAEGEINGDRRDYNWGMIPGDRGAHGTCAMQVDASIRRAEPPDRVKGDVARTMFYMGDTYGFRLSNQDRQLFTAWSRQDPPDAWEVERNRRIKSIQGKGNRFIEDYAAIFGKPAPVPTADDSPIPPAAPAVPTPAPATPTVPMPTVGTEQGWRCGLKTRCREMGSCDEARFYLTQCGVKSLDGDGDGVPCASLCK